MPRYRENWRILWLKGQRLQEDLFLLRLSSSSFRYKNNNTDNRIRIFHQNVQDMFHGCLIFHLHWETVNIFVSFSSVRFGSIPHRVWLCDRMNHSMPDLPVCHQLPEFTQTHVHWVSDAIQPSHPPSSSSPTLSHSQHQGLFQWVNSSHQMAKGLEFQLQHLSFQWIFRVDFL